MDTFKIEKLHGYLVGKTAFTMKHKLHNLFKSKGYSATPEHWAILNLLEGDEGLSQSELAGKTTKDKTNITRILDVMQKNGLIQRRKNKNDRRVYRIFLTDKGRALQSTLAPFVLEIDNQACIGLSAEELNELKKLLTKMYANFNR